VSLYKSSLPALLCRSYADAQQSLTSFADTVYMRMNAWIVMLKIKTKKKSFQLWKDSF